MSDIEKLRRKIAEVGGYEWCEDHNIYRWWGPSNCSDQHPRPELPPNDPYDTL